MNIKFVFVLLAELYKKIGIAVGKNSLNLILIALIYKMLTMSLVKRYKTSKLFRFINYHAVFWIQYLFIMLFLETV